MSKLRPTEIDLIMWAATRPEGEFRISEAIDAFPDLTIRTIEERTRNLHFRGLLVRHRRTNGKTKAEFVYRLTAKGYTEAKRAIPLDD